MHDFQVGEELELVVLEDRGFHFRWAQIGDRVVVTPYPQSSFYNKYIHVWVKWLDNKGEIDGGYYASSFARPNDSALHKAVMRYIKRELYG